MGIYLNPGNDNFKMALRSKIYVDKTGMLDYLNQVIGTEQRYVCVSRPRRFGKSIAARMAAAYYSRGCRSEALFSKYEIAKSRDFKKNLNQYPVIHLDIAELKVTMPKGEDLAVYLQKCVIEELRKEYSLSDKRDEISLPLALAEINERTKDRFIIIIDEWDAVFREDLHNQKVQDAYIDLLRGLFKGEKSHRFTALAYLTGILPIKRYNSESALNNFREHTMISPKRLAKYAGFTEDEVRSLCRQYDMNFSEAQRWYDGYGFRSIKHIYCPNSVANAMFDGEFNSYWTGTVAYESLKSYITLDKDGLKEDVIRLLAGERCKVNAEKFENDLTRIGSRDDVLTILIHLGYLAYDRETKTARIPNEEIRLEFAKSIRRVKRDETIRRVRESDQLIADTVQGNAQAVAAQIEKIHAEETAPLFYHNEQSLRSVIKLAYFSYKDYYLKFEELPSGDGYADIVYLPKKPLPRFRHWW